MPQFQADVELPCSRSQAFDYVRRPSNFVQLMIPNKPRNFEYQLPKHLEVGSLLKFSIHQFGMKFELVHEVVELVEQERITLNQKQGPFRRWFHECAFVELNSDQTRLTERVNFEGPSGFLGMVVTNARILEEFQKQLARKNVLLREQFVTSKAS